MKRLNLPLLFSMIFIGLVVVLAIFIPLLPIDPNQFDPNAIGEPMAPSFKHPFGTDDLGRGQLLRAIYGARISIMVALVSVGISVSMGIAVGVCAGFFGGKIDEFLMRFVDLMMAIPSLFLILTIQVMLTPSLFNVMIVIGLTSWMGMSRLVRAEVLRVNNLPFVFAARARGIGTKRLLFKHMLPHTLNPIIVAAMLGMGGAILVESVLSFLGLGVQPPHPSWGNMLEASLSYMYDAPWMMLVPGLLITFTVLALNYIGDYLRQKLNPVEHHA